MKLVPQTASTPLLKPILPTWIMNNSASQTLEDAAFSCGSALALLHVVLADPNIKVPIGLLRNRLALNAAVNCCKIEGRVMSEPEIRDAFLLAVPDDEGAIHRGPDGDMLASWQTVVSLNCRGTNGSERYVASCPLSMREFLVELFNETPEQLLQGTPLALAYSWAKTVLEVFPRQEAIALQCADIALANAVSWPQSVPLCGLHLKREDLRALADDDVKAFQLAFYNAVTRGANDATRLAHDLARRAQRLRAIAPKLRAKGSDAAVDLFLSEDAVLPSTMLSPCIQGTSVAMSPRAARRLCDRLMKLGVVRELTGRSTFRLYGVA